MSRNRHHDRRRLRVPEVIQTSSTDCGPACLASLLAGFGVAASYGHLRDVCYTDVDGTSIDDLEDVAVRFGLDAHQAMIPVEHLLDDDAGALPAIAVLSLPAGVTHFVVLWRKLGPWVQMMDPAAGRRWIHQRELRRVLHVHSATIPVEQWHAWACSEAFIGPLSTRMLKLGLSQDTVVALLNQALDDDSWRSLATLDAATRMLESIAAERGANAGREAAQRFAALSETIPLADQAEWLPERWFGAHAPPSADGATEATTLTVKGAVLVAASGRARPQLEQPIQLAPGSESASPYRVLQQLFGRAPAAVETEAHTTPVGVLIQLVRMLGADGLLAPATLIVAAAFAGLVTVLEALLFKGLLDLERWIHAPTQRAAAVGVVALFVALTLVVDLRLAQGVRTIGRRLETRLRVAFSLKLARLSDRYFSRRLTADLTQRIHAVVQLRGVPAVGESLLRSLFSLLFITAGIIVVDPGCAPYALVAAAVALGVPLAAQPRLAEMQLSVATYQGGLSRYFLDALLGALPLRAHAGQEPFRRGHEQMLGYWAACRRHLIRTSVLVETLIAATGMLMSGVILYVHLERARDTSSVLLLLFWSQQLPQLGRALAQSLMEYPARRAAAARVLEPINTPDDPHQTPVEPELDRRPELPGVALAARGVKLELGRTRILDGLDFELAPGCHCAVIGPSGAGKSSLLGLLLGWHRPSEGQLEFDGRPLDAAELARLRETTAWLDPQVLLWSRSLLDNLRYGVSGRALDLARIIEAADLRPVIDKLPEGLSTPLGEGGGVLSEGERQRVRLARALARESARLVLLDEPFRGLDRATRARYFAQLRRWWPGATVLCVTHDVSETLRFDRVMVIDEGRVVEHGPPSELAGRPGSIYRSMLDAEQGMRACFDQDPSWIRWRMHDGRLTTSES